ncbi:cytochrome P450 [Afifella sp. H1R]|nr:cytochrome P450 [Afifella sp. H1R]MCF1505996.1 cytochrome P450 [Afifella sp. H1R]
MLRKTICMTGPEAARLFYDQSRFMRQGAMIGRIQKTLLGKGGVQGLDDEAHRHRKQMFMSLMTPERIEGLMATTAEEWQARARLWALRDEIVLYDELHELLTRAACAWAGVPLPESQVRQRTHEITALFDAAGSVGPAHWRARWARKRANRWIENIVGQIRSGQIRPPEGSAASIIAEHRDLNGELLSPHVAAVEVLNVIRPIVAVGVYVTFVAHALHQFPECRRKLEAGDDTSYTEMFVQEVRRFYPFFPAVAALVRGDFEWRGYRFPARRRVILDLYGTNHDARTWDAPEVFQPERFREWDGSPFSLIPQGGGNHDVNHRCPGEWITIGLMKQAADVLARRIRYDVPEQDLQVDYSRLPALPRSRFIICRVREATSAPA